MQIRSAQKLAWENKVAQGLNTTDISLEFCLLQGEIAEAFDAWRKGPRVCREPRPRPGECRSPGLGCLRRADYLTGACASPDGVQHGGGESGVEAGQGPAATD